jgi:Transposase domain (DUF772)
MMGQQSRTESLFYYFRLEEQITTDHLLPMIASHVDFSSIHEELKDFCRPTGRPSIDPEVPLRLLMVGYLYGITSERRLMEEGRDFGVHSAILLLIGTASENKTAKTWMTKAIVAKPQADSFKCSNGSSSKRLRSVEPAIQNGITRPNNAASENRTSTRVSSGCLFSAGWLKNTHLVHCGTSGPAQAARASAVWSAYTFIALDAV